MDLIQEDRERSRENILELDEEISDANSATLNYDSEFSELCDIVERPDDSNEESENIVADALYEFGSLFLSIYGGLRREGVLEKHIDLTLDGLLELIPYEENLNYD